MWPHRIPTSGPQSVCIVGGTNGLRLTVAGFRAAWSLKGVLGAGAFALGVSNGFLQGLDQIVAELAHVLPFQKTSPSAYPSPPGSGPSFMNAFSTLAVTFDALLSQPSMGSAWPQAMELADHTAPSFGVVK